jgi:putative membrane protein
MEAIAAFSAYLAVALIFLAAFVFLYSKITPYDDFALIRENNAGAAVILAGAVLGFTFPLLSAIYYTHSLVEMAKWAGITGVMQLIVIGVLRRTVGSIPSGHTASAILLAALTIAVGMLNAASISY